MMHNVRLAYPWVLLALVVLPLLWYLWLRPRRRPVIRFSGLTELRTAGGNLTRRLRLILPILRSIALICLIVAAARPQRADESSRVFAEGIAIQIVVDRSSSMVDYDLTPPGQSWTRLDVVKDVVRKFVAGDPRMSLPGRVNDLIGIICYSHYPDSICPLTLDRDVPLQVLDNIKAVSQEIDNWAQVLRDALIRKIGQRYEEFMKYLDSSRILERLSVGGTVEQSRIETTAQRFGMTTRDVEDTFNTLRLIYGLMRDDGTAIGDALALAVERLKDLKRTSGTGEQLTITSRIVILLTDGEDNMSVILPKEAGDLAAKYGIKVYTILAGTGERRGLGFRLPVDDRDLRYIAQTTGGKHFRAQDKESLEKIYAEIDELERTEVEERRFVHWGELSRWWLVAAFACIGLQTVLDATRLRKIP